MKYVNAAFIFKNVYSDLLSVGKSQEEVNAIVLQSADNSSLSFSTLREINELNSYLYKVLGINVQAWPVYFQNRSEKEDLYAKASVRSYFDNEEFGEESVGVDGTGVSTILNVQSEELTKCYEITSVPGQYNSANLLIAVDRTFLNVMTANKDNLAKFYLDLFSHCFDVGAETYDYIVKYLDCKKNESYFNLVKNKIDRVD